VPWVRVVIVDYNSGPLLAQTLAALARQTEPDFEAVVVDNASAGGPADASALPDSRFRLLPAGANLGFAAGCNLGARGCQAPWLAMLNPDAVPEPGWLAALQRATLRHPAAAAFGSTQIDAADPCTLDGAGDCYSIYGIAWRGGHGASVQQIQNDFRVFSPCAAAALSRRGVFESAGGFAEPFFCYLEDVDLGFRLNLLGYESIQVADARVRHTGGASSGGKASPFALSHVLRNSLWVVLRCMPFPLLLSALAWQLRNVLRAGPRALRLQALRDGLAPLPALLRQRRAIQAGRRISVSALARLLVWNPGLVGRLAIVPLRRAP